eukprot:754509-Hanusia_phi.AAC.1
MEEGGRRKEEEEELRAEQAHVISGRKVVKEVDVHLTVAPLSLGIETSGGEEERRRWEEGGREEEGGYGEGGGEEEERSMVQGVVGIMTAAIHRGEDLPVEGKEISLQTVTDYQEAILLEVPRLLLLLSRYSH